jgi:hypothetical protein
MYKLSSYRKMIINTFAEGGWVSRLSSGKPGKERIILIIL